MLFVVVGVRIYAVCFWRCKDNGVCCLKGKDICCLMLEV
jgi:hypothetical protein